jgi:hypothetical protein
MAEDEEADRGSAPMACARRHAEEERLMTMPSARAR